MPYYAFANLLEDMTSSLESLLDFIGNSEEETQHIHREFVKHPR